VFCSLLWDGCMVGRFSLLHRSLSVSCGPMCMGCREIDGVALGISPCAPDVGGSWAVKDGGECWRGI
jgi:hypothetical protein